MTDKVQKIREEVERLKEETSIGLSEHENGVEHGRMEIINALSIFLDSMQEEPQVKESAKVQHVNETCKENGNSLTKELDKYIHDNFTIEKDQLDKFGIEEKDYMYSMDKGDMLAMVRHFAKWQKEKDSVVSEDLEEEIQKTIHNHFFDLDGIAIAGTSVYATVDDMVYIAKHFANWQKEQFKNALDLIIELVEDDPSKLCEVVDAHYPNWCENNCENFNQDCLMKYLKHYKKEGINYDKGRSI